MAIKGLGGYHLACDAANEQAVTRLRARKGREEKPLAVMTSSPELLVELGSDEEALLRSAERPIVLARRRAGAPVAPSVAPATEWLGVMLPYTPLHYLLCTDFGGALVMTSGNLSDEPIAFENEEAQRRLSEVADAFPIRRSRGYAPAALPLPVGARSPLVASGAELKSTFCVVRGDQAFLSPHLGDLDSELAYRAFRTDLELYLAMLAVEPELVACDLHPDYLSSKWAREQELELVEVQHHHAHADSRW